VPRRIFGPKMEGVAAGWRRLHNEKCHNFITKIIRTIKSARMRFMGYVACMGGMRNA